ncbi:uncharacterized protein MELLADRAFT_76697 [Melampsora larici-populina 98AG31]|uniref:DH domain-containing protein n=1 Tax=Melampsora larici-populina (strain 98AG31 / pathotype 3-4-7) TaxID=747676 RepID=F4R8H8_MELLP|nr:uncharacterized protein MELLADRAFT_76697 [Melampsora larici-populina 98AG31]EGG11484.1 hypothetical protein MELLADRAFT_76697 [Melampsora larici-populina 98AG31]
MSHSNSNQTKHRLRLFPSSLIKQHSSSSSSSSSPTPSNQLPPPPTSSNSISSSSSGSSSSYQQQQQQEQQEQHEQPINPPQDQSQTPLSFAIPEATRSAPDLSSPLFLDSERPEWLWINSNISLISSSSSNNNLNPNNDSKTGFEYPLNQLHKTSSRRLNHERSQSHGNILNPQAQSTRYERRFQALLEICDTEAGYLRDLRILVHGYLSILERAPFINSDHKIIVRRNVDQVLELAERFSRRISLAMGSKLDLWRTPGSSRDELEVDKLIERLSKAFISESPIFTVYEDFCARHPEAADIIRQFESSPEWISFVQQCRSQDSLSTSSVPSSSLAFATQAPLQTSLASLGMVPSVPNHSRLRLQDFAIKPIQRIMRYPLLLTSLLQYMDGDANSSEMRARDKVYQALGAMKEVATGVDDAKSAREIELKTELIASRMELHFSYRAAFVSLLGQIQLVGSLHVLYHGPALDPNEAFKIKYHGIFLYQTHLVIVKVKRASVYEPRHWFPIRYFELVDIPESTGIMPHSFSLKYRQHSFEFGAMWEPEKKFWMAKLKAIKDEVENLRSIHLRSDLPLNDDSIVSSINLDECGPSSPTSSTPNSESKPSSSASGSCSPILNQGILPEEPLSYLSKEDAMDDPPSTPHSVSQPMPSQVPSHSQQSRVSQRLSRNVNTLLGRTPEVVQAAIDLKLTEVFSDVLLAARLQGQREQEMSDTSARQRTLSGPGSSKRHSQYHGSAQTFSSRASERKMKRMSYMEPSSRILFETKVSESSSKSTLPPLPVTLASPVSIRSTSSSLRRAKTGPAPERPASIDLWRLNRASTTNSTRSRPPSTILSTGTITLANISPPLNLSCDSFLAEPERDPTCEIDLNRPSTSRSESCDGGSSSGTSSSKDMQAADTTIVPNSRHSFKDSLFSSPEPTSENSSATTIQESSEDRWHPGRKTTLKSETSVTSLRGKPLRPTLQTIAGSTNDASSRMIDETEATLMRKDPEIDPDIVDLTLSPNSIGFDPTPPVASLQSVDNSMTGGRKMTKSATHSTSIGSSWLPGFKLSRKLSRASVNQESVEEDTSVEGGTSNLGHSQDPVAPRSRRILSTISVNSSTSTSSSQHNARRSGSGWVPSFIRSKSSTTTTTISRGGSHESRISSSGNSRSALISLWNSSGSNPEGTINLDDHQVSLQAPISEPVTSHHRNRSSTSSSGLSGNSSKFSFKKPSSMIGGSGSGSTSSGIRSFLRMTPLANQSNANSNDHRGLGSS